MSEPVITYDPEPYLRDIERSLDLDHERQIQRVRLWVDIVTHGGGRPSDLMNADHLVEEFDKRFPLRP